MFNELVSINNPYNNSVNNTSLYPEKGVFELYTNGDGVWRGIIINRCRVDEFLCLTKISKSSRKKSEANSMFHHTPYNTSQCIIFIENKYMKTHVIRTCQAYLYVCIERKKKTFLLYTRREYMNGI